MPSTAPKRMLQNLCTENTPVVRSETPGLRQSPLVELPKRCVGLAGLVRIDLTAYIVGQHAGIGQGPNEVDEVPNILIPFRAILSSEGGHRRAVDAAENAVINVNGPPPAAIDIQR